MTDRKDMDRPATATAAVLGVALIGLSAVLFAVTGGGGAEGRYSIAWTEGNVAAETAQFAAQGQTATLEIDVADRLVSNATVAMSCTDNEGTPPRGPATITWRLLRDGTEVSSGNGNCNGFEQKVPLGGHPDVAEADGPADHALEHAYEDATNMTATYTLEVTYTRSGGTGNLPGQIQVVQPSLTGNVSLTILQWEATATEKPEGDVR
jgi:hypothetical protein